MEIINTIITDNIATNTNGGDDICCFFDDDPITNPDQLMPIIRNSCIDGRTSLTNLINNGSIGVNYNNAYFSHANVLQSIPSWEYNLYDLVSNADFISGSYCLSSSSPCIDAGLNEYIDPELGVDINGLSRVYNEIIDIGAVEYQGYDIFSGEISGDIDDDITWINEIIMTGNCRVWYDDKLTILPGTIVKALPDVSFVIKGDLVCDGTEEEPIIFTSLNPEPTIEERWNGLYFHCWSQPSPDYHLSFCKFENLKSSDFGIDYGGAISVEVDDDESNFDFTIENCIFQNNIGNEGGAIFFYKDDENSTSHMNSIIEDCIFENNSALLGGAINISNVSPLIRNNIFNTNHTIRDETTISHIGGGIFVESFNNDSEIKIINNQFVNNHCGMGGGIAFYYSISGAKINNNTFYSNHSYHGGGIAISSSEGNYEFSNNIFWGNSASYNPDEDEYEYHGGGAQILIEIEDENSIYSVNFSNCDIDGGIDNINNHTLSPSEIPIVVYDLSLNEQTVPLIGNHIGNIDAYPKFEDLENNSFSITGYSPCANAGDNNVGYLPEYDLSGNPRVYEGIESIIDIGAYEFQGDPYPIMIVMNVPLDFGEIDVNNTSTIPINIANSGYHDLLINGIDIPDGFFISLVEPNDRENISQMEKSEKNSNNSNNYSNMSSIFKNDFKRSNNERDDLEIPPISHNGNITLYLTFNPDCYGLYSGDVIIHSNDPVYSEEGYSFNVSGTGIAAEINICAEIETEEEEEIVQLSELIESGYFDFGEFPANNTPTEPLEFIIQNKGNIDLIVQSGISSEVFEIMLGEIEALSYGRNEIAKVTKKVTADNKLPATVNKQPKSKELSNSNDREYLLSENNNTSRKNRNKKFMLTRDGEWSSDFETIIPANSQQRVYVHFTPYLLQDFTGNLQLISNDKKNNEDNDPDWDEETADDETEIDIGVSGVGCPLIVSSTGIDQFEISGNIEADTLLICPEIHVYEDINIFPEMENSKSIGMGYILIPYLKMKLNAVL